MPDSLGPPGCPYDPGNAGLARRIDVRTVTLHRTIGRWPGDYSVGKTRDHNSGTFQLLIGQGDGQWVQFYPINTFCSHAAGSNNCGPGIEISGQNGEPLTDWQIDALGKIMRWLRDDWGIAQTFREGDPRTLYDDAGPSGFVCHNSVFYPNPRYIHHDYITEDEFNRAFGTVAPPPPIPMGGSMPAQITTADGQENLFYVDDFGNLVTKYLPTGKSFSSFTITTDALSGACRQRSTPVVNHYGDNPNRIDVYVEAANGGLLHAWNPGGGDAQWYAELL
jgi:hypothetical protein